MRGSRLKRLKEKITEVEDLLAILEERLSQNGIVLIGNNYCFNAPVHSVIDTVRGDIRQGERAPSKQRLALFANQKQHDNVQQGEKLSDEQLLALFENKEQKNEERISVPPLSRQPQGTAVGVKAQR